MSKLAYRPDIDGLRTVAILPVVLFHLGCQWIPGGYLGVDIFFVISGYLISAIILKSLNEKNFSFKDFWARRIRRIFPVLATMVIVTCIVAFFLSFRQDLGSYGKVGLAAIFSLANIVLWREGGDYWGAAAEDSPFLHTWSLSVEEQFYLFHPLLLFLVFKWRPKYLLSVLTTIFLLSLGLFLIGTIKAPTPTFYLLPTRCWEMTLGAIIAVLHIQHPSVIVPRRMTTPLLYISALLIVVPLFYISGQSGVNFWTCLPVIGTAFLIFNREPRHKLVRTISVKPMVYIGKLSYSLYIWHWPVIVIGEDFLHGVSGPMKLVIMVFIMTILTMLSYYLIEQKTRYMKRITMLSLTALACSLAVSTYLVKGGYEKSYDTSAFQTVEYYGQQYDLSPKQPVDDELLMKRKGIIAPPRNQNGGDLFDKEGLVKHYGDGVIDVVVLGDSHALMWCRLIDEICKEEKLDVAFMGMTGTSPFFKIPVLTTQSGSGRYNSSQKVAFDKARIRNVHSWKPKLVMISSRWTTRKLEDAHDLMELLESVDSRVMLMGQPPELGMGNRNTGQFFSYLSMKPLDGKDITFGASNPRAYENGQKMLEDLTHRYKNTYVFKAPYDLLLDDNMVLIGRNKTLFYYDDDHLSFQGTKHFKNHLKEQVLKELK